MKFNFYVNEVLVPKEQLNKVKVTNESYIDYIEKLKQKCFKSNEETVNNKGLVI